MYILFLTHYLVLSTDSPGDPVVPTTTAVRRMLTPPPPASEFMGMAGYAPASFHDLMDDEVESDGSNIGNVVAPSHPLSWECAMVDALEQPPVVVESL